MTKEEMTNLINTAVTAEDALAQMPDVIKKIAADYDTRDSLAEKNTQLEEKVRSLQDTNLKLYLAQTGGSHDDDNDSGENWQDAEGWDAVDTYFKEREVEQ